MKQRDGARGSRHERGYDARWTRLRDRFLRENPLCAECLRCNRDQVADVVDHIQPVRDFPDKRLLKSNLQALCVACHAGKTAMEQYAREIDLLDELPIWVADISARPLRFRPSGFR
ncbi:HNH endonuclease [uncultured Alsobacter sp.]|uniref:HNH endonuclease n=1 Tax=uncultured Alsobacter sp. TaxID=1748258 RepID=UPI00345C95DA